MKILQRFFNRKWHTQATSQPRWRPCKSHCGGDCWESCRDTDWFSMEKDEDCPWKSYCGGDICSAYLAAARPAPPRRSPAESSVSIIFHLSPSENPPFSVDKSMDFCDSDFNINIRIPSAAPPLLTILPQNLILNRGFPIETWRFLIERWRLLMDKWRFLIEKWRFLIEN